MRITDAGAEVLHLVDKITKLTNRIEDLEGEILYLKGSFGRWAKEPPTKPGWYWVCEAYSLPEVVEVQREEDEGTELVLGVYLTGETARLDLADIKLWWSIPILEPPTPEDKCQNTKE